MKAIIISCFMLAAIGAGAQPVPGIPRPIVYFSFNSSDPKPKVFYSQYNNSIKATRASEKNGGADRFENANSAIDFPITGAGGFPIANDHFVVAPGHHFGANSGDNYTIACWVKIKNIDKDVQDSVMRQIFYGVDQNNNPTFALMYKGHDIFMRRYIKNGSNVDGFDYKFWAPIEFNTSGWYEVFLVVGKRSEDNMQYVKLYLGKPNYIAYDAPGPRVVTAGSHLLAFNFGGAYDFCSVKDATNDVLEWGLGNSNSISPVDGGFVVPADMIDDFAVWNSALTENEAKKLFDCQSQRSGIDDKCWLSNELTTRSSTETVTQADVESVTWKSGNNKLEAYSKGKGTLGVNITLAESQGYNLYLFDINGRLITKKENLAGFRGLNVQQLHADGLKQGVYIVKAAGMELNLVQKVQVF